MILDLLTAHTCPSVPLVREAALGRIAWDVAAQAMAANLGAAKVRIESFKPLAGRPGIAEVYALLASRVFVSRWRAEHGEAMAAASEGDGGHTNIYLPSTFADAATAREMLQAKLAEGGTIALGIDTEDSFHALQVHGRALPGEAANAAHCLLESVQELSRSADVAAEIRRAQQDIVLRFLESGGTSAFVVDRNGWVKNENSAAIALIGEILHFSTNVPQVKKNANETRSGLPDLIQLDKARASQHAIMTPAGRRLMVYSAPWGHDASLFPSGDELLIAWDMRIDAPLFSHKGERASEPLAQSLRRTFGLTRMESVLASQLIGSDLRTAAKLCGMAYETARSHLKSMFGRMKIRSQGELVALLARFTYHERLRETLAAP